MPRWASSSTASSIPSYGVTNISPNVRGSTKRSCPPCVKVIVTWVCFGMASRDDLARSSWPDMPRWTMSALPSSSFITRYLPRRLTAVILRPSSSLVNCLRCRYRRMLRIPSTSTPLIFLPTTSRSRSRRTTSTSGSSGIRAPHRRSCRGAVVGQSLARLPIGSPAVLRTQLAPRGSRRRLLGLLLRATLAGSVRYSPEHHRRVEALGVIGTLVVHVVPRQLLEPLRGELLQSRLVVVAARPARGLGDALAEESHHHVPCCVHAAVEVHGRDNRLHRVGEDRRLLASTGRVLPLPEPQARPERDRRRDLGQHLGVDDRRPHLGELALLQHRVRQEDIVGD